MESVRDANDRRPKADAFQEDGNGTWLRHEGWYADKMHAYFGNCHSRRISLGKKKFYQMVIYYARVLH
jgi:hypothetical protein